MGRIKESGRLRYLLCQALEELTPCQRTLKDTQAQCEPLFRVYPTFSTMLDNTNSFPCFVLCWLGGGVMGRLPFPDSPIANKVLLVVCVHTHTIDYVSI
jgi:hypothetical protein